MDFLPLIDHELKSDQLIEVLEAFDMQVVYDFDRLHEGADDLYWSQAPAGGFEFRFDAAQRLDVIFLYVVPRQGFAAVDAASLDVPAHASLAAAREAFEREGLPFKQGEQWIKAFSRGTSRHYEFSDGALSMITLMRDSA